MEPTQEEFSREMPRNTWQLRGKIGSLRCWKIYKLLLFSSAPSSGAFFSTEKNPVRESGAEKVVPSGSSS